jgi:hypothetical protein
VSSLALYNFIRYDQEFANEETVAILDVGAENTDLVLYQGEMLWMRTLAASGNDITKAFMKKFRVSFEEAEQLKRQLGESRQADKVFKVIEGSLNELLSEVTRSFGFYKQTNNTAKIENLVISGNTFKLPNLPQYFADRLRMAIITLEDLEKIKVEKGIDRTHFLHDLQSLGVAMGLAVQGCGVAKANVNLMPTGDRLQQLLKTKRWAAAAVLAMLFISLALCNMITNGVIAVNVELVTRIRDAAKKNETEEQKARETLALVWPRAQALAVFDPYGRHKGLNVAVHESIAQVIADSVAAYGPVKWTPPPELLEGDERLQRLYLSKIEFPGFAFRVDPFKSLAEERKVVIEILIVREDKDLSPTISAELLKKLQELPVPAAISGFHHGKTLFTDVQTRGIRTADLSFWYQDAKRLDEQGNLKPVEKDIRVKASLATFDCTIAAGGEAKP